MIRTASKVRRLRTGAVLLSLVAALLPFSPVSPGVAQAAGPTELFFSEYVEGSSNNKVLEIYNGTGSAIDLAAGAYDIQMFFNGAGSVGLTIELTGNVADGDVYVVANANAVPALLALADQTNGSGWFNGDDAVVLRKGGAPIDVVGQIGFDPGAQWGIGLTSTQDNTLRRLATVCLGDTDGSDLFDPSLEWDGFANNTFDGIGTHTTDCDGTSGPSDPVINEFVANHTSSDTQAFIEVLGDASTDYSAFTILEIEGESSNWGVIDAVLPVGTTSGSGYWTDSEDMENGTLTILLVENFSGSAGTDLDTDNDGTLDSTPWTRLVDDVAVNDGGGADLTYSSTVLGPFFDGNPFGPGGASRIPNGTDTDTAADWVRNDFDGFGFPGFPGSPALGEAENTPGAVNVVITVLTDPVGVCGDPATLIHDIQGAGLASGDVGNIREIEGVVVGDFQGSNGLNGFNVQEETDQVDGNPSTSEGIFVFDPANATPLDVGDVVRVRGTVTEFFDLTQINNVVTVLDCESTGTASPATVNLPVASIDDFEPFEGMAVNLPQTLYASGNFTQARFGEVDLSVGGALDNPTNVVAPGAPAIALQDLNNRSRIQLDDGSSVQNPLPLPPYLGVNNTLRTGDTVAGVMAVMGYSFGLYELHPTAPVDFTRVNPRSGPPEVGGTLQVAAYNVLNYFTTIDNAGPICGPLANQGCRGADTPAELTRQRDKLVTAISTLDADVVGLMEIENHAGDVPTADLVAGINAAGIGTYDFIATGAIGSDAIRLAMLYQPDAVTPVGGFEVLDSSDIPAFDDTLNRPMLVQTFVENASGHVFTVAVNHLKSKGSNCNGIGDPDTGDGQGNCNLTRTAAAQAIVDFLATDPTGSGDEDFLIVGDLNAYAKEDPISTIKAGGYTDLIETLVGTGLADGAYSFNFFSQSGYLDHALASAPIASQVTGAAFWHTNSDEPSGLDYNNFNQPGLYSADEYRASDHDPVVVGLDLNAAPVCVDAVASSTTLWSPNHKYNDIDVLGVTDADGDDVAITITGISQDEAVDAPGSGNTAPDSQGVGTSTAQVRAERVGGGNGRVYHITYTASDGSASCSGEVTVGVAPSKKGVAVDDGALFDSTVDPS
jgi:predicted extracellular nuclease